MELTTQQQDTLHGVERQLNFMGGMILAWNTDHVELDEVAKDGFFYMLESMRKELKSVTA